MSLPLDRWCVSLDSEGRMKKIDAELKERLAPFAPTKSARFRFAYELAFALVCWDRTDATLQSVLRAFQAASGITSSYGFPPTMKGGEKGGVVGDGATLLRFSALSRPFRAALVQEEMEAFGRTNPFYAQNPHAMRRVA